MMNKISRLSTACLIAVVTIGFVGCSGTDSDPNDGGSSESGACAESLQDQDGDGTCRPTCETASLSCDQGSCTIESGSPVCECNGKFTGPNCSQCESGFQDHDGDGTCKPDCSSASLSCANGRCDDSSGEATCKCLPGYKGSNCESCASGYQDNDDDGTCEPSCSMSEISCNEGECDDSSGRPTCKCGEGYKGAECDACVTGYQDNDDDGTCEPGCELASVDCVNGSCDASSGTATCQCDEGYTGSNCSECASGFQDNNDDGTCKPNCSTAELDCGSHAECSDANGEATCECVTAYERVGGVCTWAGRPDDPGFQKSAASSPWTTTNNAVLQPDEPGSDNPGQAAIKSEGDCSRSSIAQTFEMPPYSASEPLKLKFTVGTGYCIGFCGTTFLVGMNGGWHRKTRGEYVGAEGGYAWPKKKSLCLGTQSYGGEKSLAIVRSMPSCSRDPHAFFDNVRIEPVSASECPAPGALSNGDFESGSSGWTFNASSDDANIEVIPGAGTQGSKGAKMDQKCGRVKISRTVSFPTPDGSEHPAIEFSANIESDAHLVMGAGDFDLSNVTGDGTHQTTSVCLPSWMPGTARQLYFERDPEFDGCGESSRTHRLDDVSIVSDSRCEPGQNGFVDGGFELSATSPLKAPWLLNQDRQQQSRIVSDSSQAHDGDAAVRLDASEACEKAFARRTVQVPESSSSKGPAVEFWYRTADVSDHETQFEPVAEGDTSSSQFSKDLEPSSSWKKTVKCLPPRNSNLLDELSFEVRPEGSCGNTIGQGSMWIDDVKLKTDSTCPTE